MSNYRFASVPEVIIVAGGVDRPPDEAVSQFSASAASRATAHLRDWSTGHKRPARIGVTWGRQLHYIALAANAGLIGARYRGSQHQFMPLLGLPIGDHRADTMSSSEIAKLLNGNAFIRSQNEDYDLQLVPAYFPEQEFSKTEIPSLYKLLCMIHGWRRVFGAGHMTDSRLGSDKIEGDVNRCDFIWSSISDFGEPFGLSAHGHNSWTPFSPIAPDRSAVSSLPLADCGGIPLWGDADQHNVKDLESSFRSRWTGIRREQWLDCVERGFREQHRNHRMSGVMLFAPTVPKARSVLHALRDGLANILILGVPCAKELIKLLEASPAAWLDFRAVHRNDLLREVFSAAKSDVPPLKR